VRDGDRKGRHTTTSRELFLLDTGGILVDTPGIREVGVFAEAEAVAETFPDVDELVAGCRFADCGHDTEPGCAVTAALAGGTLDPDRLARWQALQEEVAAAELRNDPTPRGRYLRSQVRSGRGTGRQGRPGR